MTALAHARQLDASDNLVEAAIEYERAIAGGCFELDVYLDLAVLYLVLLDLGEAAARRLTKDYLDRAWRRANQLLEEANLLFGHNSEIEFWRRYFAYSVLGSDPFTEECKELARGEESLVPFFYLFAESGGCDFQNEAGRLLQQVDAGATARQRYIKSILESPAITLSHRVLDRH